MIKKNIIAFVHAKGNSTRVPNKNIKLLGDKPLFCYAIENAKKSNLISEVVIDSDSDEILDIGERYGATPLKRPALMASNATTGDDLAYWQASQYPYSDIVLQVIPTSPFINAGTIDKAIECIFMNKVDSVVGVSKDALYIWRNGKPDYFNSKGAIPNSFDLEPTIFETTGLYVNKTGFVLDNKKRINIDSCFPFFLNRIESIDINTVEDFEFAEIVQRGMKDIKL